MKKLSDLIERMDHCEVIFQGIYPGEKMVHRYVSNDLIIITGEHRHVVTITFKGVIHGAVGYNPFQIVKLINSLGYEP